MSEVLSQEEIDNLLTAIASGVSEEKDAANSSGKPAAKRVKPVDFNRPVRFSSSQVRAFSRIHEVMAHGFATRLSSRLAIPVRVHVASVDQLTFEEFIRSLPNPATLVRIEMEPFDGPLLVEIDRPTAFAAIDRLLGGQGEGYRTDRDLTEIESALVRWLVPDILSEMSAAWQEYSDTTPGDFRIEENPNFVNAAAPGETVLLATMETSLGDVESMINVAISYPALRPLLGRLTEIGAPERSARRVFDIANLPVETTLWSRLDFTVERLLALRPGDLIDLPELNQGILHLDAGDRTIQDLRRRSRRGDLFDLEDHGGRSVLARLQDLRDRRPPADTPASTDASRPEEGPAPPTRTDGDAVSAPTEQAAPFSFLDVEGNAYALVMMIQAEHPQTIAFILSCLGPTVTAEFFEFLQPNVRADILRRMTLLDWVRRDVAAVVESVVREKQEQYGADRYLSGGGLTYTRAVLRAGGDEMKEAVLRDLQEEAPDLAKVITLTFVSFADIGRLSDQDLPFLVARIDPWTLTAALAGTGTDLVRRIAASLTPAGRTRILELRSAMAPIEPEAIAAARERIVDLANRMVEFGGSYAL